MRESNYSFPPQNRAVVSITQLLYDRRGKHGTSLYRKLTCPALDTNSSLALLNNLTSLTYLTSTSPRIREHLTLDSGLERLLDVLRESCLPRESTPPPDLWGLNGISTAKVISVDRQISLRHSLAFQCVVNIGVRGSEAIRTRVVQAGALDLVAQILESWLQQHGVAIFAGPLGSQAAVDAAQASSGPTPSTETRRRARSGSARHTYASSTSTIRGSVSQFVSNLTGFRYRRDTATPAHPQTDTDVEMADAEAEETTGPDDGMELDGTQPLQPPTDAATPRVIQPVLPIPIPIPPRPSPSQASSTPNSLSGDDLPRAVPQPSLLTTRIPRLGPDAASNQSSPMGTPPRPDDVEGLRARRGTIVGRPLNLAPRNDRQQDAGSGTSDGGEDLDMPTAIIVAGIAAAEAQAIEAGTLGADAVGLVPTVEIVDDVPVLDDPDPDALAAEQARLDMEAGAPPGHPGAAQTPRAPPPEAAPLVIEPAVPPAQVIIANGAPRGFQDLGSYVGINSLLNPDGDKYSDDSILLALQLLAYLSKYPHVRTAFHHPRRPMHPTFDLKLDALATPLPQRPACSKTPNIFSLVERFTFRPSPSDPTLFRIPQEIQYWAGVIMRNACRKDEANGGIRQCANMSCGRWESYPREFAKCRRCRKAKYCSKDCQSKAWADGHRFWCNVRPDEPVPAGIAAGQPPAPEPGDDDDGDGDFPNADLSRDVIARIVAARLNQTVNGPQAAGALNDLLVPDWFQNTLVAEAATLHGNTTPPTTRRGFRTGFLPPRPALQMLEQLNPDIFPIERVPRLAPFLSRDPEAVAPIPDFPQRD